MADSLTPNLKLRINDDLTADSKYNLNRIDSLGSATKVENNGNLRLRSVRDIVLTPESQDLGGAGTGGTVSIGEAGVPVGTFEIFADVVDFNNSPAFMDSLRFLELPANGTNYVGFTGPDDIMNDVIWTLPNADGAANQVLVTDGAAVLSWATVLTDSLAENNVNVGNNSNVGEAVDTNINGDILADTVTGFTLKPNIIDNDDISLSAAIELSKLEPLTMNMALVSDGAGEISASAVTDVELGYLAGLTSSAQTQLDNKQPLDTDLTALAALATNGLIVKTGSGTSATRSILAGTGINITNGDGIAGDITIDSTITQYTDTEAEDAVAALLMETDSINFTYVANTSISADLKLSAEAADAGSFLADVSIETDGLKVQINESDIESIIASSSYAENWLNADGVTKVITHNLNTRDVMIEIYDNDTFETILIDSIVRTDVDTVTLTATEAPAVSWRVLVKEV